MRQEPTWRIPIGILALLLGLAAYGLLIAWYVAPLIGGWHALLQLPVYVVLGVVWIAPLKRFLMWMETGHIRYPPE
ncbi:MAG: DUF2842 domain-containing protein [Novosphingobium sp.]